jgi:hypothetical protein
VQQPPLLLLLLLLLLLVSLLPLHCLCPYLYRCRAPACCCAQVSLPYLYQTCHDPAPFHAPYPGHLCCHGQAC